MFEPIDIIYKPIKRTEIEPLCYFSDDISKACSSLHSKGKEECPERINASSFIIAIAFLFWKQGEKDIWKIVQEDQELFIILITKT